jgi:hypothetical protein
MYNEDVANLLEKEFGKEMFMIYCQIEQYKNNLLHEECVKSGDKCTEYEFERDWWKQKFENLVND